MKVDKPILAFGIYFGIGIILLEYGIHDGSFLLFDILIGTAIYKAFSRY